MTKQEAIEYLSNHYLAYVKHLQDNEEIINTHNSAIDIAIESIEKAIQIEDAANNAIVEILRNAERIEQFEGYEYGKLSLATRWIISTTLATGIIKKHLMGGSEDDECRS